MEIRTEKRYNNALSILRGPLYYSLRIGKQFDSTPIKFDNFIYMGSLDWQIAPTTEWNYGLMVDRNNPKRGFKIDENPIGKYPFSDKGDMIWSADSGKFIASALEAPVVITARGMKISGWIMKDNSADIPPVSPVKPEGDPVIIKLVPYGCARLRITEFPVMDIYMMEDVMRPAK
jgi:hypothetical protein